MSSAEHREHVEYVCPYPRLKDKLDERFILRGLFDEYWRIRRAESSDSWLAQVYAELYDVAVKLYSFIASYQDKTGTCAPGSEDDPRVFWSLAQPLDASEARPGIIDVYAHIITSDDFLHSPPALIDHILWGFGALFWMRHSWIRAPGRSEKKSVYSVIFSHTPKIWKCLWDHRSHIRARSQNARDAEGYGPESVDPCHEAFGNYPEPYSRLLEWYAYLYDGYIEFLKVCTPEERSLEPEYARYMDTFMPHVGLLVWASGNEQKTVAGKELAVQRLTTSLLDDLSTDSVILTVYKERIAREAVVEGIGAHTFFDRFETVMKQQHADTYKAPPMHCIQLVLSFVMTRSLSPYLADHDVLHPIVQMCNFYGRTMQRDFWDMTITFFMFVTEFVGGHVPDEYKDYVGTTHALVRGGDIIDFLARGIDCLAGWDLASEPAVDFGPRQGLLRRHILHYTTLIAETRHKPETHSPRDLQITKEMMARAPSQWWPCLRRLRNAKERGTPCTGLIEDWSLLGAACDLDLAAEGMRIASRNVKLYCSLSRCEYHVSKPPLDIALKTCKGCGEVKYCSRVCQVQHWKEEHKRRCGNRLRGT